MQKYAHASITAGYFRSRFTHRPIVGYLVIGSGINKVIVSLK